MDVYESNAARGHFLSPVMPVWQLSVLRVGSDVRAPRQRVPEFCVTVGIRKKEEKLISFFYILSVKQRDCRVKSVFSLLIDGGN
jgi:hypothetical protein